MRYRFAFVSLMAAALASAAIHGTVRDSSGAPVPRARIYLLKPPQPARVVTADSAGVFQISETTSGVCTIFASAPGLTGDKVEIPCQSATIALALHPSAVSETIVVTADRAELPSSAVASSVSVLTPE